MARRPSAANGRRACEARDFPDHRPTALEFARASGLRGTGRRTAMHPFRVAPRSTALMSNKWIGAALSLALCSTALVSCSARDDSSSNATGQAAGIAVDWNGQTERQLRAAIAEAPANGLKPELFLKGGERGAALTEAALKYASALANGYSDPRQLHEVYTIPYQKTDVRQGLAQAIQKGDVKSWLESLAPQTDEYRALSQAHLHYLQLASK